MVSVMRRAMSASVVLRANRMLTEMEPVSGLVSHELSAEKSREVS